MTNASFFFSPFPDEIYLGTGERCVKLKRSIFFVKSSVRKKSLFFAFSKRAKASAR